MTGIAGFDHQFMAHALALARRGLGQVAPNPAVGCVIVRETEAWPVIVGRGWTQAGGRPHAETEALARAGDAARGAHCYVTLEPCAHHRQTPPCAEALIKAGIKRVVVAVEDPDPRVCGKGLALIRQAGIETVVGVGAEHAAILNQGFFARIMAGRPLVTMKMATSLDGRIATGAGESKWITGGPARALGHLLRARHDAILTGVGTIIMDDPELTCRLPGLQKASPIRVVADSWLRLPEGAKITRTAREIPTWVVTLAHADPEKRHALERHGVEIIEVEGDDEGHPAPLGLLQALAARGVTRLLIEAGATVNTAFLKVRMVDHLAWFRAPSLIGGDGLPVADVLGVSSLDAAQRFSLQSHVMAGGDLLECYRAIPATEALP